MSNNTFCILEKKSQTKRLFSFRMTIGRFQQFKRFRDWFIAFHFKNWKEIDIDLVVFHVLSIVLLLGYCIIDTIMYSCKTTEKSDILKFLHGSRYLGLETFVIIYSSGVA